MSAKRGLGTGLGALFGEEEQAKSEVELVPIARLEPREGQPRANFDEESLAELASSIAEYGLIQPITVRRLPSGYYQIIAGERRWRASRLAGLGEVPVRIIEADDRLATELALVENLQREDLNPLEEAQGYRTLIEEYGLTQDEAAKRVGKSRPVVTNALRLLALAPEVQQFIEQGLLSAGHARAIAGARTGDAAGRRAFRDKKRPLRAAHGGAGEKAQRPGPGGATGGGSAARGLCEGSHTAAGEHIRPQGEADRGPQQPRAHHT